MLGRIVEEYQKRFGDLADAVTEEVWDAPSSLAQRAQVPAGMGHLATAANILKDFKFEEERGETLIVKEAVGVCSFITPWNWPLNQIVCKVAPAIATGCTMVLKPSEVAPFSGQIFAEIMHAAGVPKGVFNMVHGDGPGVGVALSSHPDVDMVSFTGSTRAGIEVAKAAAPDRPGAWRRNWAARARTACVLDDDAFAEGVGRGVGATMPNSGQSCNAPSRMLVPKTRMDEAIPVAREAASTVTVGDPNGNSQLGPVVNKTQFDKIQKLIQSGIDEGATLVIGGTGPARRAWTRATINEAHGLRQCDQRHDHRPRGDLRPGALDPGLRQPRSGGRDRQRHGVRPGRLRPVGRHRERPEAWRRHSCAPARCRSTAAAAT